MPSDAGAPLPERVLAAELEAFACRALIAVGLPESEAAKVAHLMVEADLIGADGHGIFRLPQYVRRIEGGGVEREPGITINRTATSTAIVDGGNGMGHLVVARAAETAIELATEAGISWVGIRNSKHAGPASLLESALKQAPGHAIPPLAEMLLAGEGGSKDEKRAVSMLNGPLAFDVGAVRGALGRLMIEGRLVPRNIPQGIQLVTLEAVWPLDALKEVMVLLAANPKVSIHRPESYLYDSAGGRRTGRAG